MRDGGAILLMAEYAKEAYGRGCCSRVQERGSVNISKWHRGCRLEGCNERARVNGEDS